MVSARRSLTRATAALGAGILATSTLLIADSAAAAPGDAAVEQVPGGDFQDGTLDPFFATAGTTRITDGVLCVDLPGGTTNRWDQIVGVNGIVVEAGTTYTLSFDASSSTGRPIRAILGDDDAPYDVLFEQNPTLTSGLTRYEYTFTPGKGFPAAAGEDPASGQVAFQVGGSAEPWTFCLDNVSLLGGTEEEPYAPETGPRVRVNQVGYLPEGPKQATLVTEATDAVSWQLQRNGTAVASGQTTPAGVDPTAGLNVHVIDFGNVTAPGEYTLVADGETSYAFEIGQNIYQQLRADALNYFYPVRSGIAIDGSIMDGQPHADEYTRDAGHVENPESSLVADSPNKGDYDVPCLSRETEGQYWKYGDWTCDYTLDVTGGWYDAGDHGKYVVNGGIAVAQLLGTYERTLYSPTGTASALEDGSLNIPEADNGIPDVLDEARWELEWMMSMQVPEGAQYAGMIHHKVADVDWTGLPLLPSEDPQARYLHRPSTAATLNFAAVAAQGARLWAPYDAAFAEELLAAGEVAWHAAVATPNLLEPAPNADPNPGSGPYNDAEIGDEFYWAAAELFLTTGEQEFEDHVLASKYHTADIWTADGFDWGHTAALGRLDLATVESDIAGREQIRASVISGADRYLAWQEKQPFGTSYPGKGGVYQWGSNSMVLNNQVVLATAFDLTSDQRYADAVLEAMDYLLGRNALNNSYITGYGDVFSENQHSRWFAHSIEPSLPNPPRGSVSGGPNSDTGTWDPVIKGVYTPERMCAPQFCYLDDIQSWSTNEITVNWNSALSWVASFVADQGAGDRSDAGQVVRVTGDPQDATVRNGSKVTFTAAATGAPAPTVQWQVLADGVWKDVKKGQGTSLTITATKKDSGSQYRAFFENEFGGAYTEPATVTVTEPGKGKGR
ncbi:glycoside hydrolase family 9 protein [Herbiconiux sp. SYSU D00978]|uniref:glycoside hydrolase family 9 protein n=1 Tax=Herbiconiux sp. SYSU D00978 TaxID=2812562 RepID=UPI0027DC6243|nr:glycoside hydrolase family 9 protein [Herbiconiux sp. SYSU D00978]